VIQWQSQPTRRGWPWRYNAPMRTPTSLSPVDQRRFAALLAALQGMAATQQEIHASIDSLVKLLEKVQEKRPSDAEQKSGKDDSSQPMVVALREVAEFLNAHRAEQESDQNQTHAFHRRSLRLQRRTLLTTVAALIAASYFAYQQRILIRQQLVGSQAAIVTLTLSLYPNSMLSVNFDQRGVAAAKNTCLAFHAVRKAIPDLANIELPISHTACEPVLSDKVVQGPQEFGLPGLTPAEMEAIRRTEQTVMVTGEFSYNNGFGDIERQNVCLYWLSGIPDKTEAEGGGNGFVPCDGFSVRLNNVLKARREGQTDKR
jgi:hypothetical protein